VGGNALIKDPAHQTIPDQYQAVVETSRYLTDLIESGMNVVLTHGNGPQVGFIMLRSELAREHVHPIPMDVAVADTQGAIGYHFQQCLNNEFRRRNMIRLAVAVVTTVVVDPADPAFSQPTKPVGVFMSEETARIRQQHDGWVVMEDAGRGWRRVVPSPQPHAIVELDAILNLVSQGFTLVACGGGGIPVVEGDQGELRGVAAVIDKDLASSLLARQMKADVFLVSTGVETVFLNYGRPDQQELRRVTLAEARQYLQEGHFKPGSMKPKVEAVLAFLEGGGRRAIITNPPNMERAVRGETGTEFVLH